MGYLSARRAGSITHLSPKTRWVRRRRRCACEPCSISDAPPWIRIPRGAAPFAQLPLGRTFPVLPDLQAQPSAPAAQQPHVRGAIGHGLSSRIECVAIPARSRELASALRTGLVQGAAGDGCATCSPAPRSQTPRREALHTREIPLKNGQGAASQDTNRWGSERAGRPVQSRARAAPASGPLATPSVQVCGGFHPPTVEAG